MPASQVKSDEKSKQPAASQSKRQATTDRAANVHSTVHHTLAHYSPTKYISHFEFRASTSCRGNQSLPLKANARMTMKNMATSMRHLINDLLSVFDVAPGDAKNRAE
eukprot:1193386-Prorocentrum_minimum.AAC.2